VATSVPVRNDSPGRIAQKAGEIRLDHGGLEYRECVGEDLEVMKDPRLAKIDCNEMPLDCKRMAYGGFEVLVDAIAPVPDRVKRSQS